MRKPVAGFGSDNVVCDDGSVWELHCRVHAYEPPPLETIEQKRKYLADRMATMHWVELPPIPGSARWQENEAVL